MCSTPVVYVSLVNMQTGSFVSLLHFQLTKMLSSTDIYTCSVLKDGRAFLGTLALDSNCIVWCTCCVVFTLCALKLHIHPVDDCSFPFFFLFSFLISCFSIIWGVFCMTMQGGPGSTPAHLRMIAGPHISSGKLRPGTSIQTIAGSMACVCSSLAHMPPSCLVCTTLDHSLVCIAPSLVRRCQTSTHV